MSDDDRMSIGELRRFASEGGILHEEFSLLAEAAEALRDVHEEDCGCAKPGGPACAAGPTFRLLERFDFGEADL